MLETYITTGKLHTDAAIEFADPFASNPDRFIGMVATISPDKYLNGVDFSHHPANNTFTPVALDALKNHPTAIESLRDGHEALKDRFRSGGKTKVFSQTNHGYELTPPSVHEHVGNVVNATFDIFSEFPQLERVGFNLHDAIIMGVVHDIGEGSTLGDLPATADPASYSPFHGYLRDRGLHHLLQTDGDTIVGLNQDPAYKEEIAYSWKELQLYFRESEARHAAQILADNEHPASRNKIEEIYDRFENRDPNDLTAQLVRTRDIRSEIDQYVDGRGWRVEPYITSMGMTEADAADLVQNSMDVSIRRMMEPVIHLAHTTPWPAVENIRTVIERDLARLYDTDYPEKADLAIAFLHFVMDSAIQQSEDREGHLELNTKGWQYPNALSALLEIPPPSV